MALFSKFFGLVAAPTGAPILGLVYAIIGFVFAILCFGRWIMPHAALDLTLPWAIVCLLLFATGAYGYWGATKGSNWHKRQFVSASWGFLLMYLCWAIVYIAVENNHVVKVNGDCEERNPEWDDGQCEASRQSTVTIATVFVTLGMVLGIYFTLVVSRWVSGLEWEAHLEEEQRLEKWRRGQLDPHDTIV
ncbi:hypothetical protein BGZ96_010379 [Linnemannia gamsii]|uniref:MARVEL domain-containing protein n=1 Tax=Linnemannia gamsii TaxID=64522 RepID=A0ABQ7JV18_9FUNG|nr:hypothetical protein BGZ96_010379 [Linnemannia gamsii]